MSVAKANPKTKSWRGGVVAVDQRRASLERSANATIDKRRDELFRLRFDGPFECVCGDRLIVEADYETVGADVVAVHPFDLVDVTIRAGLDEHARRVKVRRSPL